MNYEWLFAFVVFAEHLNFTRASKQLHISQPALHVQIRKLADAVGCPLYRRTGRALSLTPEGKRLASFGREVQQRGDAVLGEIRGRPVSGPVVLAAGEGALLYLLGPAIRRFPRDRWPLRLMSMRGPDAVEAVRDARAHVGVAAFDSAPADLQSTRLRSVGQHAVLPASHRLARRRSLRPLDLDGEPLVVPPEGSPHRVMLEHALHAAGARLDVAVEATGWEPILHFARHGLGIAIVNDFCATPKGMVGIPVGGMPRVDYHVIVRSGLIHEGVEALRNLIIETARA